VPPPPEARLAWFESALDELPAFLLSPDVFRPLLRSPASLPQDLSLGALLLALDALDAGAERLPPADQTRWSRLRGRWETERSRRRAAIERKAQAELRQRSNLWRAYIADLRETPREAGRYAHEVRHRVAADRLLETLGPSTSAPPEVAAADASLRGRFITGAFVWEPLLEKAYRRDRFWFLYGRPSAS